MCFRKKFEEFSHCITQDTLKITSADVSMRFMGFGHIKGSLSRTFMELAQKKKIHICIYIHFFSLGLYSKSSRERTFDVPKPHETVWKRL